MSKIEVGSRVVITGLAGKKGEVKFIGKTRFAEGDWVGIRLDTPDGKNDGTVGDHRYFTCEPLHGLFVKSAQVRLDKEAVLSDTNSKLAALRERRKQREEETATTTTASAAPASAPVTRSAAAIATRRASVEGKATTSTTSAASSTSSLATRRTLRSDTGATSLTTRSSGTTATSKASAAEPSSASISEEVGSSESADSVTPSDDVQELVQENDNQQKSPQEIEESSPSENLASTSAVDENLVVSEDLSNDNNSSSAEQVDVLRAADDSISAARAAIDEEYLQRLELERSNWQSEKTLLEATVKCLRESLEVNAKMLRESENKLTTVLTNQQTEHQLEVSRLQNQLQQTINEAQATWVQEREEMQSRIRQLSDREATSQTIAGDLQFDQQQFNRIKQELDERTIAWDQERRSLLEAKSNIESTFSTQISELQLKIRGIEAALQAKTDEMTRFEKDQGELERSLEADIKSLKLKISTLEREMESNEAKATVLLAKAVEEARSTALKEAERIANERSQGANAQATTANTVKDNMIASLQGKVQDLESQISELNDNLEMVTLDKEQLVLEKEILEETNKSLTADLELAKASPPTASIPTSTEDRADPAAVVAQLTEENNKLRDALRRLHQISTSEADSLRAQLAEARAAAGDSEATSEAALEALEKLAQAEEQISELQAMVDAGSAYEQLIEKLTATNLDLSTQVESFKVTVADFESEQELTEELDMQQRQEIDALRKALDSAVVEKNDLEQRTKGIKDRLEDSKRVEDKYKRTMESQREEIAALQLNLADSQAQLQRQIERYREASSLKQSQVSLAEDIRSVKQSNQTLRRLVKSTQATLARWDHTFGQTSIFSAEQSVVNQEVKVVSLATTASTLGEKLSALLRKKFDSRQQTNPEVELNQDGGAVENTVLTVSEPASLTYRVYVGDMEVDLLILRCACLLWHASAVAVFSTPLDSQSGHAICGAVLNSNLAALFEQVLCLVDCLEANEDVSDDAWTFLSRSLQESIVQIESFIFGTSDNSTSDKFLPKLIVDATISPDPAGWDVENRVFHTLTQISYFRSAISSISMWAANNVKLRVLDPLTHQAVITSTPAATNNVIELVSILNGGVDSIAAQVEQLCMTENGAGANIDAASVLIMCRNHLRRGLDTLCSMFDGHFSNNLSLNLSRTNHSATGGVVSIAEETMLTLLRRASVATQEAVAVIRNALLRNNSGINQLSLTASSDGTIVDGSIHIASSAACETLWSWLLDSKTSTMLPLSLTAGLLSDTANQTDRPQSPKWIQRTSKASAEVLAWEANFEALDIHKAKSEALESDLARAREMLKSALSRNIELEGAMEKLSISVAVSASSGDKASSSGDDDKLKEEIKMLKEALSVFESGQEQLEKENKSLKASLAKQGSAASTPSLINTAAGSNVNPPLVAPTPRANAGIKPSNSSTSLWDSLLQQGQPLPVATANQSPAVSGNPLVSSSQSSVQSVSSAELEALHRVARVWRRLATENLTKSLVPLPSLSPLRKEVETSKSEPEDRRETAKVNAASNIDTAALLADIRLTPRDDSERSTDKGYFFTPTMALSRKATATKLFRDIRCIRASIRLARPAEKFKSVTYSLLSQTTETAKALPQPAEDRDSKVKLPSISLRTVDDYTKALGLA